MKQTILSLIVAVSLLSSCKKDKDKNAEPREIIQLQQMEEGNNQLKFIYNDQNLLN